MEEKMNKRYIFLFPLILILLVGSVLPAVGQDVGDIITFGSYEQEGIPGLDPIEWQVLAVENGRALVISRYILEAVKYNEENYPSTWEDCSLRRWLNEEFYNTAFSAEEKNLIQTVSISNPDNPKSGTAGGNDTVDRIFILDFDEANAYLPEQENLQTEVTDHAIENGIYLFQETRFADWWLRTPGTGARQGTYVGGSGKIWMDCPRYEELGVRPVFLMNLTDLPVSLSSTGRSQPSDISSLQNTQVGDIITFGSYTQDQSQDADPIEWYVLAVENGKAFAVSRYGLDAKPYNEEWEKNTWETSTLRAWLNDDFYSNAFSDSEKAFIAEVNIDNPDNPDHGTGGGNSTVDRIFLLSIDEKNQYVPTGPICNCYATDYAKENGARVDSHDGLSSWWLRSPGENGYMAASVNHNGRIRSDDCTTDDYVVRPAFWLKIEP